MCFDISLEQWITALTMSWFDYIFVDYFIELLYSIYIYT